MAKYERDEIAALVGGAISLPDAARGVRRVLRRMHIHRSAGQSGIKAPPAVVDDIGEEAAS